MNSDAPTNLEPILYMPRPLCWSKAHFGSSLLWAQSMAQSAEHGNYQSQDDGSAPQIGIERSRGKAGSPDSRCSNVIRQPKGPLLKSCVDKKWDSRYKGESTSLCEGDSAWKEF